MILSSSLPDWWWSWTGPLPSLGLHFHISKVDFWAWFQQLGNGLPRTGHLGNLRPKHGGRAKGHQDLNERPPQAHAQDPFLPFTPMTLLLRTPPTSPSVSWSLRSSASREKGQAEGRTWEFPPLHLGASPFYLSSERGSSGGCWGLALAWRVIPCGLAPTAVAQRSSLCSHPCQGALWWCQSSCRRAAGLRPPWSLWELTQFSEWPQNGQVWQISRVMQWRLFLQNKQKTKTMPKPQNRNEREKPPTTLPSQEILTAFFPVNFGVSGLTFFPF